MGDNTGSERQGRREDVRTADASKQGVGRHRRSRTLGAALASALAVVGTAVATQASDFLTSGAERVRDEGADQVQARLDAQRLKIDHSFPGDGCSYGSAVRWERPENYAQWQEWGTLDDGAPMALEAGAGIGGSGVIRMHFTLPKTADLANLDIRSIRMSFREKKLPRPDYVIARDGCPAAGQYRRAYSVIVHKGQQRTTLLKEDGSEVEGPFEPFTVEPGETVHLDYKVVVCDPYTYEMKWQVDYMDDLGGSHSQSLPPGRPLMIVGYPDCGPDFS